MTRFDHERIPVGMVNARGTWAFGYFEYLTPSHLALVNLRRICKESSKGSRRVEVVDPVGYIRRVREDQAPPPW